jgi:hypothetical protein
MTPEKQTFTRLVIMAAVVMSVAVGASGISAAAVESPTDPIQIEQADGNSTASPDFEVAPTVDLSLQSGTVTADNPGQIELYMDNSRFNDQAVLVELRLEVPPGTEVTGGNFFEGSGANTVRAEFTIDPGTERTTTANIYPDQTGDYYIDAIALYQAEGGDDINQQIQSYPMVVEEAPDAPSDATSAGSDDSTDDEDGLPVDLGSIPWTSIAILVIVSGAAIALVVQARSSGEGATVEIEE